jgi:hypothetical protein
MKIKIKRAFSYQQSPRKVVELSPGIYDVGRDISKRIADSVLRFGKAEVVVEAPKPVEKKAPENKVVGITESKAKVEAQPVRRGRPRSKPST